MTAPDDLSALSEKPFAEAVVKFEELLAQSGRAFLIGAGCSKCAGLPLTAELTQEALSSHALDNTTKALLAAIRDLFVGAADANIEDYLSELIDLLAIAERRTSRGALQNDVTSEEFPIAKRCCERQPIKSSWASLEPLRKGVDRNPPGLCSSFASPARPGKRTSGQTVDYLVLNYDTVLEDALALERVPFADGLEGGVTGWWSPQTFDRGWSGCACV